MIRSHTGTPASYLAQFARVQGTRNRKPRLWVYGKGSVSFTSTPAKIGRETGYFATTNKDGSRDESLENFLANFQDGDISVVRNLTRETYVSNVRDREKVSRYVSLMFARATARRDASARLLKKIRDAYYELADDADWLQEQVSWLQQEFGANATPEQIKQMATTVLRKLETPKDVKNGFVQGLVQIAESIFTQIIDKPWQIWEAPEATEFVTTDNPVITFAPDRRGSFAVGCGFATPGLVTMLTISPQHCLVIGAIGPYWRRTTARNVFELNRALIMCMDRWAYSASRLQDVALLVDQVGGSNRYLENTFVPAWMDNDREYLKLKVAEVTRSTRIVPRLVTGQTQAKQVAG